MDLSKKINSFWHLEFVTNVIFNWDRFLKSWNWCSNSVNNKGFFNWNDIDLSNFKFRCKRGLWDCLDFDKIKVINFR